MRTSIRSQVEALRWALGFCVALLLTLATHFFRIGEDKDALFVLGCAAFLWLVGHVMTTVSTPKKRYSDSGLQLHTLRGIPEHRSFGRRHVQWVWILDGVLLHLPGGWDQELSGGMEVECSAALFELSGLRSGIWGIPYSIAGRRRLDPEIAGFREPSSFRVPRIGSIASHALLALFAVASLRWLPILGPQADLSLFPEFMRGRPPVPVSSLDDFLQEDLVPGRRLVFADMAMERTSHRREHPGIGPWLDSVDVVDGFPKPEADQIDSARQVLRRWHRRGELSRLVGESGAFDSLQTSANSRVVNDVHESMRRGWILERFFLHSDVSGLAGNPAWDAFLRRRTRLDSMRAGMGESALDDSLASIARSLAERVHDGKTAFQVGEETMAAIYADSLRKILRGNSPTISIVDGVTGDIPEISGATILDDNSEAIAKWLDEEISTRASELGNAERIRERHGVEGPCINQTVALSCSNEGCLVAQGKPDFRGLLA
ncbi:MAG: hypothetical protein H6686_04290 [Fibrobacteria bacterium]|nr:hypothetical protein [Fibrobacteria bacterium]